MVGREARIAAALSASTRSGARLRLRIQERRALLACMDGAAAIAACACAYLLWEQAIGHPLAVPKLGPLVMGVAWVVGLMLVDGYSAHIPSNRLVSVVAVFKAAVPVTLFGVMFFYLQPYRMSRPVIALSVLVGVFTVGAARIGPARLLLHRKLTTRAVMVSGGTLAPEVEDAIAAARHEYNIVGEVVWTEDEPRDIKAIVQL